MVSRGMRSPASTALTEQAFDPGLIEPAFAHIDKNMVRRRDTRTDALIAKLMTSWLSEYIVECPLGISVSTGRMHFENHRRHSAVALASPICSKAELRNFHSSLAYLGPKTGTGFESGVHASRITTRSEVTMDSACWRTQRCTRLRQLTCLGSPFDRMLTLLKRKVQPPWTW